MVVIGVACSGNLPISEDPLVPIHKSPPGLAYLCKRSITAWTTEVTSSCATVSKKTLLKVKTIE